MPRTHHLTVEDMVEAILRVHRSRLTGLSHDELVAEYESIVDPDSEVERWAAFERAVDEGFQRAIEELEGDQE